MGDLPEVMSSSMSEQLIAKETQISDLEKWIEHLMAKQFSSSAEAKKATKELELKTQMSEVRVVLSVGMWACALAV